MNLKHIVIFMATLLVLVVEAKIKPSKRHFGMLNYNKYNYDYEQEKEIEDNVKCQDTALWCSTYKSYCNYKMVHAYCKDTCGKCASTIPIVSVQCIDKHYQGASYCETIKKNGHCQKEQYKVYFKANCAKSCGYCGNTQHKCGVAHQRSGQRKETIVGGVDAKKGYYPWQAAIYHESKFLCGGTLINKRYIMTAAHCFNGRGTNTNGYKIVLGEHNRKFNEGTEETYLLENIKIHESYSSSADHHDIALMKMNKDVEYTNHINSACLPSSNAVLKKGSTCYISGWGKDYAFSNAVDQLQELKVPVVDNSVCAVRNAFNFHKVTDRMICTGTDDGMTFSSACHGDSGGPLSCELSTGVWTVMGVVSWGSPLCNGLDRYTAFTRVSSYKDWIDTNIS